MKEFVVPQSVKIAVLQKGDISFAELTAEVIMPRPGFRVPGNVRLTDEIYEMLETATSGAKARLSDRAYELLVAEYQLPGGQPQFFLGRAIAKFQIALEEAQTVKDVDAQLAKAVGEADKALDQPNGQPRA